MNDTKIYTIGIDCRLWNETGVGRYIRNLVWELAKVDAKNNYILFFKNNEYSNVELPGKNFQKRLANIHWHSLKEQTELPKILNKEKMDIVHFPYFSIPIFYNKPYVITIHDLIINHFPTGKASTKPALIYWWKLLAYKIILYIAVKKAKKIIAVSAATKKEVLEHYRKNANDVAVTLEGIDTRIFNLEDAPASIKESYFLYVGNAYPHKNLDRLILAFKQFRETSQKNIKLILVGKEDFFYKRLKQLVKKENLGEYISFYEKVSDSGLALLYTHALALVAPSLMEGFGLPVIEAMANNCVVLASSIDAFEEICKDTAVYFNPRSIDSIAKTLIKVAENKLENLKEKKQKGARRAQEFSWKKMAEETVQVYESSISL